MSILDFRDIYEFSDDSSQSNETEILPLIFRNAFDTVCYRNDSGRTICFEDTRKCTEYEDTISKGMKFFHHPYGNVLKTYILQIDGYLLVDNDDLNNIVKSNPILMNLVEHGKIKECSEQEVKEHMEKKKSSRHEGCGVKPDVLVGSLSSQESSIFTEDKLEPFLIANEPAPKEADELYGSIDFDFLMSSPVINSGMDDIHKIMKLDISNEEKYSQIKSITMNKKLNGQQETKKKAVVVTVKDTENGNLVNYLMNMDFVPSTPEEKQ